MVIDDGLPFPERVGRCNDPHGHRPRADLKPIEITQPEGPSFTVDGNLMTWADWKLRVGFDAREGLMLHQLGLKDGRPSGR